MSETDQKTASEDEQVTSEDEQDASKDEPISEPVDQGPALRDEGTINLGLCHFGSENEPASRLATRSDGTGWIAVCDEHTKDAEERGFVVEESKD